MPLKVYIETTIVSYLTAWPSSDTIRAGHQQITKEWWSARGRFELFTSQLVHSEAAAGDPTAADERLAALAGITLLELTEATELADALVDSGTLPRRAYADALHIAVAAVHGLDFLLTWNCRHIANAANMTRIEGVCRRSGYEPPRICTPEQLLDDLPEDD